MIIIFFCHMLICTFCLKCVTGQHFLYASIQDLKGFQQSFDTVLKSESSGVRTDRFCRSRADLDLSNPTEAYKWIKIYFSEDCKRPRKVHTEMHGVEMTTADLLGAAKGIMDILEVDPEARSRGINIMEARYFFRRWFTNVKCLYIVEPEDLQFFDCLEGQLHTETERNALKDVCHSQQKNSENGYSRCFILQKVTYLMQLGVKKI